MADLPLEVWSSVCDYFDHEELKALRFVNGTFNRACLPKLFRRLHLYQTRTSLERAWSIAERPDLACYVQSLVIYQEQVSITHTLYNFQIRIEAIWGPQESEDHISRKLIRDQRSYSNYVPNLYLYWDTNGDGEILLALVSYLPSLQHLSRRQSQLTANLIEYRESERVLTGVYRSQWQTNLRSSSVVTMIEIGLTKGIRALELSPIHLEEFAGFAIPGTMLSQAAQCLHNLVELKLVLYTDNSDSQSGHDDLMLHGLREFLSAISNIRTFSIRLLHAEIGPRPNGIKTTISSMILAQHHAHLRRVEFQQFRFTEPDFLSFAMKHSETLRDLALHDIFIRYDGRPGIHPSIINLCWTLRNWLDLDNFCVGGNIDTDSREIWSIATRQGGCTDIRPWSITPSSLLQRLCESVCKRAQFPFRVPQTDMELGDEEVEHIVILINEFLDEKEIREQFEDHSWQWRGSSIPGGVRPVEYILVPDMTPIYERIAREVLASRPRR